MFSKAHLYRNLFIGFLLSVFIVYFSFRQQNSEWYRLITADGLGYYSYLPSRFIYHDSNFEFKWFNDLYDQYYKYNSFATPVENFTADYHGHQINKYYPGMSFLWMPFFLAAHAICKLFHLNANGLSQPYQMAIGFATLVYCCLGLWYLRKFLLKLFKNEWIAFVVPVAVFYGTNLFSYTIYFGTFSHAYSFAFITMALYYVYRFFNEEDFKARNALWFVFCTLIVIFIRPINILFLLAVPAFMGKINISEIIKKFRFSPTVILIITMILFLAFWSFYILYKQTGSFFPNTYYNEKFHFERGAHLRDILFSFHAGWFLYVPLAFISLLSLIFIRNHKRFIFLFLVLAVVIYLYSNWWYYTIFTRTIVDYTGVIAVLSAFLMFCVSQKPVVNKTVTTVLLLSVAYFQLKAYQFRNGILDFNYTYSNYYYRNFFTLHPVNIYPVHPKTVLAETEYFYNYDQVNDSIIVSENKFEGKGSLKLYSGNYFSDPHKYKMPDFTSAKGFSKIKTSFYVYFADSIKSLQLIYRFTNKGKELFYFANYIQPEKIHYNRWEYKEIGCDVPKEITAADSVSIFFWDEWGINKAYIDNVKHQFFLTDSSMEMVP